MDFGIRVIIKTVRGASIKNNFTNLFLGKSPRGNTNVKYQKNVLVKLNPKYTNCPQKNIVSKVATLNKDMPTHQIPMAKTVIAKKIFIFFSLFLKKTKSDRKKLNIATTYNIILL